MKAAGRRRAGRALIALAAMILVAAAPAAAFAAEDDKAASSPPVSVGVLSAGANSTAVRIVADMAEVLDGPELRIVPILGDGGMRNVHDLLALDAADVAIVQSDVLSDLGADESRKEVSDKLVYITKLFNEEVHVLARKDIGSLADLGERTVAVGPAESGSSLTAGALSAALSIPIRPLHEAPAAAAAKLKSGEIDALVYVAGKPTLPLDEPGEPTRPGEVALHFLGVPADERLLADYIPSALNHQDYPGLIAPGESIETIAVPMVMIAAASSKDDSGNLAAFIDAFFGRFAQLQEPLRHPKWRETNLAATISDWQRLPAAVDWVRANMATPEERKLQEAFADILRFAGEEKIKPETELSDQEAKALFWRFVDWRAEQAQP